MKFVEVSEKSRNQTMRPDGQDKSLRVERHGPFKNGDNANDSTSMAHHRKSRPLFSELFKIQIRHAPKTVCLLPK